MMLLQAKCRRQGCDSEEAAEMRACDAAAGKLREFSKLVKWVRRAVAANTAGAVLSVWWKVAAVMWREDPRSEE